MVRRTARRISIAGAVVLTLVACHGGVSVMRSRDGSNFSEAVWIQTVPANGTNAVVVRNSPFPAQTVVSAVQGRYASGQYRFAPAPVGGDWNGFTVIIGFGGLPVGSRTQCDGPEIGLSPTPAGETMIVGDYCYGDRTISEAVGRSPAIGDSSDPRLADLVGGVVGELLRGPP